MIAKQTLTAEADNFERCLIGSLLLENAHCDLVSTIVSERDFVDDTLAKAFRIVTDMRDSGIPFDVISFAENVRKAGFYTAIGESAGIHDLFASVPHSSHAEYYARKIADAATLRRQVQLGEELAVRASQPGSDPDANRLWLESALSMMASRNALAAIRRIGDVSAESVAQIAADIAAERKPGVLTGLWEFDNTIGSLHRSEMIVLAARPSIGKTALALQIAEHVATKGKTSLVVSLEMRDRELVDRLLAKHSGVDSRKMRARVIRENDMISLRSASAAFQDLPLFIFAPPAATMSQIRAAARLQASRGELSLLVVDYIGLVKSTERFRPRNEQVAEISASLKELAKELDVPVLVLSQLNREAETQRPALSNLRESGSIEQDADVVMFLHKESRDSREAQLIVEKNRNGEIGTLTLQWEARSTRFISQEPQRHSAFDSYNSSEWGDA